jgi:hypothetical protein
LASVSGSVRRSAISEALKPLFIILTVWSVDVEAAMGMCEDDDRLDPAKCGAAKLRVALHQEVPDSSGAGVDLFADACSSATLRPPRVAMTADVACKTLRL